MSEAHFFQIKGKIPSKKNSYEVHINQRVYRAWMQIAPHIKGGSKWWVAPSPEVKQMEQLIAWTAKAKLPDFGDADLAMVVETPLRNDLDNLLGVILDGIEQSGRIKNDKQFKLITIEYNCDLKHTEVGVWKM